MDKRKFTAKLNHTSKNILRAIIPALGLHQRSEQALTMRYIEEKCTWDIADALGITFESTANFLSKARVEMYYLMTSPNQVLEPQAKEAIEIFWKN